MHSIPAPSADCRSLEAPPAFPCRPYVAFCYHWLYLNLLIPVPLRAAKKPLIKKNSYRRPSRLRCLN
jgi:hypothetical protein